MEYLMTLNGHAGVRTNNNQDGSCMLEAKTDKGNVIFAVVCDGLGQGENGGIVSSIIVNVFVEWFKQELPEILAIDNPLEEVKYRWGRILKEQNQDILEFTSKKGIKLGTTITMMLVLEDGSYLIAHIGDGRVYRITQSGMGVLTEDQTLEKSNKKRMFRRIKEEIEEGQNVLLQCVGITPEIEPKYYMGNAYQKELYIVCTNGFWKVISDDELFEMMNPVGIVDESEMSNRIYQLVQRNRERQETDDITALCFKAI